jgi:hypothetical protein
MTCTAESTSSSFRNCSVQQALSNAAVNGDFLCPHVTIAAAAEYVSQTGAHVAVVTSQEGLSATIPTATLAAHISAAADCRNTPAERSTAAAAAAAAVLQAGTGRAHLLLLEARQQLSVCLACWQRCGWWPDAVGAVLGEYPSASAALNQVAAEEAAARAKVGLCFVCTRHNLYGVLCLPVFVCIVHCRIMFGLLAAVWFAA